MIQPQTYVQVADNSGAKVAMVIKVPGHSGVRTAGVGDEVIVSIKSASPKGNVSKKSVQRAVVVRTRKEVRRKDGSYVRFDENAVVIINPDKNPKATRVFGPVARELREAGYQKIISLAPDVL